MTIFQLMINKVYMVLETLHGSSQRNSPRAALMQFLFNAEMATVNFFTVQMFLSSGAGLPINFRVRTKISKPCIRSTSSTVDSELEAILGKTC